MPKTIGIIDNMLCDNPYDKQLQEHLVGKMDTLPKIPFNDLGRLYNRFKAGLEEAVLQACRSGWWLNGKHGKEFATRFARFIGVQHCMLVANGTDALALSLGVLSSLHTDRDEVITVANAGGYTSTACYQNGLTPVYVDIVAETQLIDIEHVMTALSEKTLVVVATHLYGGTVDIPSLRKKLDGAGYGHVTILEDCAQSHGATFNGALTGSMGDVATFSFYPTKNLGAMGDGGAILTSDSKIAELIASIQQYGWGAKYQICNAGGRNSRMDEIQSAVVNVLLPELQNLNDERRYILKRYKGSTASDLQFIEGGGGSVAHLATLLTENRDEFRAFCSARNIATEVHYPILDCDQPGWLNLPKRLANGGLPVSSASSRRIVSLPCFPGMTEAEISHVIQTLSDWKK
ncbi:DegT/DnrJ/EryC1/StrS family aminotransferase [Brucella sp. RRSP16]|uniref:DegT/DnrJ/EryC1/StrS family aminotransferase n=1 Tax=Brucella sp. RRSP16 TaxID=3453707 RepID=UPI003FCE6EDA